MEEIDEKQIFRKIPASPPALHSVSGDNGA